MGMNTGFLRFGVFEANLPSRELRKHGIRLKLRGQPFEILALLLEKPGEIVTREEMQKRLWPADTFVDFEHSLNSAVKKLRRVLGDSPENSRYIETIPRIGYRFIAPVQILDGEQIHVARRASSDVFSGDSARHIPAPGLAVGSPRSRTPRRRWLLAGAFALLIPALYWLRPVYPPPKVIRIVKLTNSGTVTPNQTLVTDGPRIYYRELVHGQRATRSVSVEGGESAAVEQPFPWMDIADISPDGTSLLAGQFGENVNGELTPWILPLLTGSPRQLMKEKGRDFGWSRDGQTLAVGRRGALYLVNPDGSQERRLVSLPGAPFTPRWSSDGRTIRFNLAYEKKSDTGLWEVDADGRNPHPVLPGWNSPPSEWGGNWTPDGKYFVFHATRGGTTDIWAVRESADIFHRLDHQPVQVTAGPLTFLRPIPSRDGSKIFAVGVESRGELVRYDAKLKQLVSFLGGISADHVSFSKNGQWVAYVSFPEQTLWRCRADGSEKLQLTFPPMRVYGPRWSPDGSRIAFASIAVSGAPVRVSLIGRDGGVAETPFPAYEIGAGPSWSPDGTLLTFSAYGTADRSAPATASIRVLNLKTGETKTVPESSGLHFSGWSPDGRYLAAVTIEGHRLMLLDWSTGRWRELTREYVDYPEWSPEGRFIYVNTLMRRDPRVLRFRAEDGQAEEVFRGPGPFIGVYGWWSAPAPDGSPLFLRDVSSSDLYAIVWQAP
jgi:Tol biopolymer transport system component/DNA-binding winged helix-turn-helix (wHTH) protein